VILDMNGVLMFRGTGDRKTATLRPHLETLMATLFNYPDQMLVAVWSSMMMHNLRPLVEQAFGERANDLAFVWDQASCTVCRVKGMHKPLLRKDLIKLRQSPVGYIPGHVLLIDDDPIKCTANPKGTAVHPASFTGNWDDELLRLSGYLEALIQSDAVSVPAFVLAQPYDHFEVPSGGRCHGRGAGRGSGCAGPKAKRPRRVVGDSEVGAASDEEWVEAEEEVEQEEGEEETKAAEYWGEEGWDGQSWEETTSNQTRAWSGVVRKTDAQMMAEAEQLAEAEDQEEAWEDVEPKTSQQEPTEEEVQEQIEAINVASREVKQTGGPWRRVVSKSEPGSYFYFNDETYRSSMEPPHPWQKRQSRTKLGVWYYWNPETGATSTEKPEL